VRWADPGETASRRRSTGVRRIIGFKNRVLRDALRHTVGDATHARWAPRKRGWVDQMEICVSTNTSVPNGPQLHEAKMVPK
jgi:hypothetical protein